jgi:cyclopropane fatty-acyl-phospholipid synthase-like methyltransferase
MSSAGSWAMPTGDGEPEDPGARVGLPGAGILGYQVGDQLHPPMVDDEAMWADGHRWRDGALKHTLQAAALLRLGSGPHVLDIGCGVGGPARTLVDVYGATVYGVTIHEAMLATARRVNATREPWSRSITVAKHDAQRPYDRDGFTVGWSMNMLYQVPDKAALLRNAQAALAPGALLLLEDWLLTDRGTDKTVAAFSRHFDEHLWKASEVGPLLEATGYDLVETQDLGEIGRTHMARHFSEQFNRCFRPRIEADFPGAPRSGRQMCDEWIDAVETTIEMYRRRELTYSRVIARRR